MFIQRITIPEIKNHPWFLKNLPIEFTDGEIYQSNINLNNPSQSVEEVLAIIQEARKPLEGPKLGGVGGGLIGTMDLDDLDIDDVDIEDMESLGDFVCPL